jgi:hypothetical protein
LLRNQQQEQQKLHASRQTHALQVSQQNFL